MKFLQPGRDDQATIGSRFEGKKDFNNDGDNEITGIHVSATQPLRA